MAKKISEYISLNERLSSEFETDWNDSRQNARIYRSKHWTEEEENAIKDDGRIPYSISTVEPKFDAILSQQRLNRSEWRLLGRGLEDELQAEVYTQVLKFVDEFNDFQYTESEVYQDALIKRVGIVERLIDTTDNPQGEVMLKKLLFDEVIWDRNCKQFNIPKHANWVQTMDWLTKDELKDIYPDQKELIEKLPEDYSEQDKYKNWYRDENGQKLVKRVRHFQRRFKPVYKHVFMKPDGSHEVVTNDKKDFTMPIQVPMQTMAGLVPMTQQQPPLKSLKKNKEYIEVTTFTKDINEELDSYEIESKLIPVHPLFCFFDDGDYWSLMDRVKDDVRWSDRLAIQIDYSIGTLLKTSYEIQWDKLHPDDQARWFQLDTSAGVDKGLAKQLTKGGAVLRRLGDGKIIDPINGGQVAPELFTTWQIIMSIIEDSMGGRNIQGLKETSNESGVAVEKRQEQALALSYMYIDNLRRWKKTLGEGLLEDIKQVYTEERTVRVIGESLAENVKQALGNTYQNSNLSNGLGYLRVPPLDGETKLDLIVDRAEFSPTSKERKFGMLQAYNTLRINAGKAPLPLSITGKYLDIDPSLKQEITQFEQKEDAMQEKNMQLQQNLKVVETLGNQLNATNNNGQATGKSSTTGGQRPPTS